MADTISTVLSSLSSTNLSAFSVVSPSVTGELIPLNLNMGFGGGGSGGGSSNLQGKTLMGGKPVGNISSAIDYSPTQINEVQYKYIYSVTNADGQDIGFSRVAVKGVSFTDNIFNPFLTDAMIMVVNPLDYAESNYLQRGDGRDLFRFALKPDNAKDEQKLEYEFIIKDEVPIVKRGNRMDNLKCYQLIDKNYQLLNESIPQGVKFKGKVGKIIEDIIKEKIGEEVIGEFEYGDHEIDINPEYIIPPVSFKYVDLIYYLLKIYYYIDDGLPVRGILNYDRIAKKYNLLPLSKSFYKKNKELAKEAFLLGDMTNKIEPNPNNPPPDAEFTTFTGFIQGCKFSTPMTDYSNTFFLNSIVHGYDPVLGEHISTQIRLKDLKEQWKTKFVDVFSCIGGKPKPFLPLNKQKKINIFKTYNLPFHPEKSANIVTAEMINMFVFYNMQIEFPIIGDVKRQSGVFVDVVKPKNDKAEVDKKMIGRWFVTTIKHDFFYESYSNNIIAVKTYTGPNTDISDDVD